MTSLRYCRRPCCRSLGLVLGIIRSVICLWVVVQADEKDFSVVLLIPDHGDKEYVKAFTHLLLVILGFKEIAVHQVS